MGLSAYCVSVTVLLSLPADSLLMSRGFHHGFALLAVLQENAEERFPGIGVGVSLGSVSNKKGTRPLIYGHPDRTLIPDAEGQSLLPPVGIQSQYNAQAVLHLEKAIAGALKAL